MCDEVAFVRIKVGLKAALVFHHALQFGNDPVAKAQAINDLNLRLLLGRHFLQRHLCPDGFPHGRVRLIHWPELSEVEVTLRGIAVVTIETIVLEECARVRLEIAFGRFAGRVNLCSLSRRAKYGHNYRAKGAGQCGHARTSLSGPVLGSNLAAIFSDMLYRSASTPEARRMEVYNALSGRLPSSCVKQPVLNAPS